jgi:hypothetical protein
MKKANPNVIAPRAVAMPWITSAYGRLRTPSRPELARCTQFVQQWIIGLAAVALQAEMPPEHSNQADDDYVPGLFADEIVTTSQTNSGSSGLHDQLIALLESASVSAVFLDAVFEASSQPDALAGHLWKRVMDRIDPDAFIGQSTHDTLSQSLQRLNAMNLFVQSKSIQKHIATEFTKDLDGTTGRDVENAHSLKRLFRLAAYTVPETIEGLDKESFMTRHLADSLSVDAATMPPEVAVFSRKGVKGYDQFQRQSRQLMESARAVCRTIIGKTMAASKGANKEQVFRWLFQIAELK